jgi:hypothetical protein
VIGAVSATLRCQNVPAHQQEIAMSALGKHVKHSLPHPKGTSAMQHTSVGSGSKPGAHKHTIETTAPKNAATMDRKGSKIA